MCIWRAVICTKKFGGVPLLFLRASALHPRQHFARFSGPDWYRGRFAPEKSSGRHGVTLVRCSKQKRHTLTCSIEILLFTPNLRGGVEGG